jgi:hypothetical protein
MLSSRLCVCLLWPDLLLHCASLWSCAQTVAPEDGERFIAFGDSLESNYAVEQCAAGLEALRGSCIVKQGCQLFNGTCPREAYDLCFPYTKMISRKIYANGHRLQKIAYSTTCLEGIQGGVQTKLHSFLNPELDGSEWWTSSGSWECYSSFIRCVTCFKWGP